MTILNYYDQPLEIRVCSSLTEVEKFLLCSNYKKLRGVFTERKAFLFWDASFISHDDLILNLNEKCKTLFVTYPFKIYPAPFDINTSISSEFFPIFFDRLWMLFKDLYRLKNTEIGDKCISDFFDLCILGFQDFRYIKAKKEFLLLAKKNDLLDIYLKKIKT